MNLKSSQSQISDSRISGSLISGSQMSDAVAGLTSYSTSIPSIRSSSETNGGTAPAGAYVYGIMWEMGAGTHRPGVLPGYATLGTPPWYTSVMGVLQCGGALE